MPDTDTRTAPAKSPGLEKVAPYTLPGHGRDAADAMWRQARGAHRHVGAYALGALDPVQVELLLQIGYTAGYHAGRAEVFNTPAPDSWNSRVTVVPSPLTVGGEHVNGEAHVD